jgi:DNA-binding MarR family transcriptional regulator
VPLQSTAYLLHLWLAASAAGTLIGRELEPAGIEPQLFGLLTCIAHREPVAPSVLATEESIPPTTIRDSVQRLVDRELVERAPNPADGRSYLLSLTPRGRETLALANTLLAGVYEALGSRLPRGAAEYEQVLQELRGALADVAADGVRAALGTQSETPSTTP